jgi:hypothetical protein
MKQLAILLLLITGINSISSQTIVLKGEQVIKPDIDKPLLICNPVKITKSMKITKVEGNCDGFWIEKNSETIHKFTNHTDPIDTIITPGVYYVYPILKGKMKTSDVSVTLKVFNPD